ncbi:hypothetical protein F1188_16150 [Roseospira marina]|uniref:Uncharacterized protein n=1 Tax=Roseospira marina TaxID=140057 RepID=A0A5M6I8B8_9PROT|nr:hypothetical protein [Roseospira marina]KAA5604392.1 hypothetical protein F1188_16150 [Roseospira marina]MBB4315419.1 hypothetical protein [Roseospira marina]MBB5088436.1 hypothetical protein [Roseospira marina]
MPIFEVVSETRRSRVLKRHYLVRAVDRDAAISLIAADEKAELPTLCMSNVDEPDAPSTITAMSVHPLAKMNARASGLIITEEDWNQVDQRQALNEGWGLFKHDSKGYCLERYDEADRIASDEAAVGHVWQQCLAGSRLHRRALFFLHKVAPAEFAEIARLGLEFTTIMDVSTAKSMAAE